MSLGLICYGILFGACFAACAGVRHFKHLQRMEVHVGYKGVDMTVSENRIFDKWFILTINIVYLSAGFYFSLLAINAFKEH